ncbi:MAG: tRNA (adenosine(37)-N6)-threonylcarbamoyltransferase complex ATPase subunit type 1 TsaE [Oscillospiraceae bacterium]|jgi:tRNA threonylcarbamoyladenosine biosynthesis protein TsaE|nr:tRNA (adenosine(37)-N6)-threonylcarbamoyltransferase complex ATPase subunit type 1 TsaE [Oscillospiraceae bacterium]
MKYFSASEKETEEIAFRLAQNAAPGTVFLLDGELGAGKTAFVRGLARALAPEDFVSSPTFAVVNEYRSGAVPLFHFDLYRLGGEGELFDIGFAEYLSGGGILAVEWPEIAERCVREYGNPVVRVRFVKTGDAERELEVD